ncbi:MAG TPA: tannase/feruloyl esterase family alpha/beta hydrolase [Caulobacteraceae bacterium]
MRFLLASAACGGALMASAPALAAGRCEDIEQLKLPDTVIKSAVSVAAGEFITPDKVKQTDLPAFCRVTAEVKSAPGSDIKVEIWLPLDHWAGVFHGNGNGGFAGLLAVGYPGMVGGLRRGYATATTDMGTAPATPLYGDPLIGRPQAWKDWGFRSTHVMTVTGKAIAKAFYGAEPRRSYYTGCSTGGQQGLIEAQYYPDDYDGVLIGAPVVNRTWGHALAVWDWQAANGQAGRKLSDAKLSLLSKAVLKDCGGRGAGLAADPFLGDPLACGFEPASLLCHGAASDACLTTGEVETVKAYYSGPLNAAGRPTYYGWMRGSEAPGLFGWNFLQSPPNNEPAFDGLFKWVFGKDWDWAKFDFARDMPKVDAALGPDLNGATRGDMSRFAARGGKLIIYQGWADTLVAPMQTVDLYKKVSREAGGAGKTRQFARLFLAPGMEHCGAGPGPSAFNSAGGSPKPLSNTARDDLFIALSRWVEDGQAPSEVISTQYVGNDPSKGVAYRRPVCAYPQKAWYRGSGDKNDAKSFVCSVEKPGRAKSRA